MPEEALLGTASNCNRMRSVLRHRGTPDAYVALSRPGAAACTNCGRGLRCYMTLLAPQAYDNPQKLTYARRSTVGNCFKLQSHAVGFATQGYS